MTTFSEVVLPTWKGWRAGAELSDGTIEVIVHGSKTTARQRAAIEHATTRAPAIQPRLVDAVLAVYTSLRARQPRPKTMTKSGLREHVMLRELIVTTDHANDVAYVAYGFASDWDSSGFYVVVHEERIVCVGDEDVLEPPIHDRERETRPLKMPTPAAREKARAAARAAARRNPTTMPSTGEIEITLPSWAGFVAGPGRPLSLGRVTLHADPKNSAYREVLSSAAAAQRTLLDAIAEARKVDRDALLDQIALSTIVVHGARVGYQFDCAWDREHGLGVAMRGVRVIAIGAADVALSPR